MDTFVLGPTNTVTLAPGTVTRLKGALGVNRGVSMLNIGPGTVYLRVDDDPSVGDEYSIELPPGFGLNEVSIEGSQGVGAISDAPAKLSVVVA